MWVPGHERLAELRAELWSRALAERLSDTADMPEDLRAIVICAMDLAYYRTVNSEVAGDLRSAVWHELDGRVRRLPEAQA